MKNSLQFCFFAFLFFVTAVMNSSVYGRGGAPSDMEMSLRKGRTDGNAEARFALAEYLLKKNDKSADQEAFYLFKEGAEQGDPQSMHQLGLAYLYFRGTKQSARKAEKWLKAALEKGIQAATVDLSKVEELNRALRKEFDDALVKAEAGDPTSMGLLSYYYFEGKRCAQDIQKSNFWLEKAVKSGDVPSYKLWAEVLLENKTPETKKEAFRLLKIASEHGDSDAMILYADLLYDEPEVPLHVIEKLYRDALKVNKSAVIPFVKNVLLNQKYQKPVEAFSLMEDAALHGDRMAMYYLAQDYQYGFGCKKDIGEAIAWLRKLSYLGHSYAGTTLGVLLADSEDKDLKKEGAFWLKLTGDEVIHQSMKSSDFFRIQMKTRQRQHKMVFDMLEMNEIIVAALKDRHVEVTYLHDNFLAGTDQIRTDDLVKKYKYPKESKKKMILRINSDWKNLSEAIQVAEKSLQRSQSGYVDFQSKMMRNIPFKYDASSLATNMKELSAVEQRFESPFLKNKVNQLSKALHILGTNFYKPTVPEAARGAIPEVVPFDILRADQIDLRLVEEIREIRVQRRGKKVNGLREAVQIAGAESIRKLNDSIEKVPVQNVRLTAHKPVLAPSYLDLSSVTAGTTLKGKFKGKAEKQPLDQTQEEEEALILPAAAAEAPEAIETPMIFLKKDDVEVFAELMKKADQSRIRVQDYLKLLNHFIYLNTPEVAGKNAYLKNVVIRRKNKNNKGKGLSLLFVNHAGIISNHKFHLPHKSEGSLVPFGMLKEYRKVFEEFGLKTDDLYVVNNETKIPDLVPKETE